MSTMANGLKLTPSISDMDKATGNMKAAVATLLMMLVMTMVPMKTTANAIRGLPPPTVAHRFAMVSDKPLPVTADSRPRAAPSTTTVFHCRLRQACSLVRHPVASMAMVANSAEFNMLSAPDAASATMATVMSVARIARSTRFTR